MEPIRRGLRELKRTVATIALVQSVIDSLVVFILCFLLLVMIKVHWYWAFVPFGIYLVVHSLGSLRAARLVLIEQKVPELQEQLRTAADTLGKDNEVVRELREEVVKKMRHVRNSAFIRFGKIASRIITLVITSFIIIFASAMNVHLLDFHELVEAAKQLRGDKDRGPYDINESLLLFEDNDSIGDIYGNKSLAELGYEELTLQLNPVESDVDITQIRDPTEHQFSTYRPKEVEATTDASYQENIPKGYRRIVKNYFREITRT